MPFICFTKLVLWLKVNRSFQTNKAHLSEVNIASTKGLRECKTAKFSHNLTILNIAFEIRGHVDVYSTNFDEIASKYHSHIGIKRYQRNYLADSKDTKWHQICHQKNSKTS